MAYDASLEERIDILTADWGLNKRTMFGGLAYFAADKMCFAIMRDEILLRVRPGTAQEAMLAQPGIHVAAMGKRTMRGWLLAGGEAIADSDVLEELLDDSCTYSLLLLKKA